MNWTVHTSFCPRAFSMIFVILYISSMGKCCSMKRNWYSITNYDLSIRSFTRFIRSKLFTYILPFWMLSLAHISICVMCLRWFRVLGSTLSPSSLSLFPHQFLYILWVIIFLLNFPNIIP